MKRWSGRWDWVNRAFDYDEQHVAKLLREALQKEVAAHVLEWQRRDEDVREQKKRVAEQQIAKAKRLLKVPLSTVKKTTGPNCEKITTITPTWSFGAIQTLTKFAFELAREAIRNE